MILNPFDLIKDQVRQYAWTNLLIGETYHLELITPHKGILNESIKNEGYGYWVLLAKVLSSKRTETLPLVKNEQIVITFPLKIFTRAWAVAPLLLRKNLTSQHNLRIKFVKKTRQTMFITEVERLVPSPEMLTLSYEVYSQPDKYAPRTRFTKGVIQ